MQRKKVAWDLGRSYIGHVSNSVGMSNRINWSCSTGSLGHVSNSATFQLGQFEFLGHVSGHVRGHIQNHYLKFFTCFLRGFWNRPNTTSICLWDHAKDLENRFLGTFKSCEAVDNYYYFIFMKILIFAKTELENGSHSSQKGLKSEFSSLLDP